MAERTIPTLTPGRPVSWSASRPAQPSSGGFVVPWDGDKVERGKGDFKAMTSNDDETFRRLGSERELPRREEAIRPMLKLRHEPRPGRCPPRARAARSTRRAFASCAVGSVTLFPDAGV